MTSITKPNFKKKMLVALPVTILTVSASLSSLPAYAEDEVMEDVAEPSKMSLPPPRLNLNALNNQPALDLSQRRTTF